MNHPGARGARQAWKAIMVLVLFTGLHSYVVVNSYAYVGFMVVELTGSSENGAGYMAGFMASAIYLGKVLSSYFWGYVADCIGRKPVMVISLISMGIFSVSFGLAKSVTWAMTSRLLMGLTCPGQIVIRTLTPEVAGSSRVLQATAYTSGAVGFAMAVGPAIGGLLAQPREHFPEIFPPGGLFSRYPYLLPNLLVVPFAMVCIILSLMFVPETKEGPKGLWTCVRRKRNDEIRHTVVIDRTEHRKEVAELHSVTWTPSRARKSSLIETGPEHVSNKMHLYASEEAELPSCGGCSASTVHHLQDSPPTNAKHVRSSSSYTRLSVVPPREAPPGPQVSGDQRLSQAHIEPLLRVSNSGVAIIRACIKSDNHEDEGVSKNGTPCEETEPNHWSEEGATASSFGELLRLPQVVSAVCATGLMELILAGFDEVYPLWAISTRRTGGLEWDMILVGQVFLISGTIHSLYIVFGYNWIAKRVGVSTSHRVAGIVAVLLSIAVPFIGYLKWDESGIFIISLVLVTLINSTSFMLYNATSMVSTNPVPPRLRGKVAGLTSASVGFGGFLGPPALSMIFAWSISTSSSANDTPLVNQHFAFNIAAIVRIVLLILLWNLLTEESLTKVVDETPRPTEIALTEIKVDDHLPDDPGSRAIGDRRVAPPRLSKSTGSTRVASGEVSISSCGANDGQISLKGGDHLGTSVSGWSSRKSRSADIQRTATCMEANHTEECSGWVS